MPNELPRSNALAEADPNSMYDLFSRDPSKQSEDTIDQIIHHMRDLRLRLEGTATVRHARATRESLKKPAASLAGMFAAFAKPKEEGEEEP